MPLNPRDLTATPRRFWPGGRPHYTAGTTGCLVLLVNPRGMALSPGADTGWREVREDTARRRSALSKIGSDGEVDSDDAIAGYSPDKHRAFRGSGKGHAGAHGNGLTPAGAAAGGAPAEAHSTSPRRRGGGAGGRAPLPSSSSAAASSAAADGEDGRGDELGSSLGSTDFLKFRRSLQAPSEAGSMASRRRKQTMAESSITSLIKPLDIHQDGCIQKKHFLKLLATNGLSKDDPRLTKLIQDLDDLDDKINIADLVRLINTNSNSLVNLLIDVLSGNMVIPDFDQFTDVLKAIFEEVRDMPITGRVADYIPALAEVPAEKFAIAVTTRSGQRFSLGDTKDFFCLQSVSKVGTYCEALKMHGTETTHKHVGREPSGESFNAMTLKPVSIDDCPDREAIPHNPCINAGAIMCTSLNSPGLKESQRLAEYLRAWSRLCGSKVAFDPMVMVSERESADTNNALAYMMREAGAFESKDIDINETLEFYFSTCAVMCSADMLATAAATLANSGHNPLTNEKVYDREICKNAMSLMLSCGMYDFSGEWAFTVGLPAKSGVSGALMIVVPNICGICVWSPPLDALGNSVKGIEFAKRLVERFAFHHLSSTRFSKDKVNPTVSRSSKEQRLQLNLMYAASSGDLSALRRIAETQPDLDFGVGDYDRRTALHLAASEGHVEVVSFLLDHGTGHSPVDRWGSTPLDDAILNGFQDVEEILVDVGGVRGSGPDDDK